MDKVEIQNQSTFEKVAEVVLQREMAAVTEHSKWILASLLSVNGGALLALGQIADKALPVLPIIPLGLFVTGTFMALLSGFSGRKLCDMNESLFGHFLLAKSDDDRRAALNRHYPVIKRWKLVNTAVSWASAICFLVGAIWLLVLLNGLPPSTPAK